MNGRSLAVVFLVLGLALACSSPTEIVLSFDSDLAAPEIDRIVATVQRADQPETTSTALLSEQPLPRTLVLRHEGGALGPVRVHAAASLGASEIVARDLKLEFLPGRSLAYRVRLDRACAGVTCGAEQTCQSGLCRSVEVGACELAGDCADAAMPDAAMPDDAMPDDAMPNDAAPDAGRDAGPDAGPDAGLDCLLDLGICGVPSVVARGERIEPAACARDFAATWELTGPGGTVTPFETAPTYSISAAGSYLLTATDPADTDCTATFAFDTSTVQRTPFREGEEVVAMAARPGMAFLATADGPWAVTGSSVVRDLRLGSTGLLVSDRLRTVEVVAGDAYFGAEEDRPEITRVQVDDAFTAVVFSAIILPSNPDQATRTMAIRTGGFSGPLAIGTVGGPIVLSGLPSSGTGIALTPAWDATRDIAMASMETTGIGHIWGVKSRHIRNYSETGGALFGGGAEVEFDPDPQLRGLLIDDRDATHRRLWLCSELESVRIYDLGADWTGLTELPTPLRTIDTDCTALAADDRGDVWIGTRNGLVRFDRDGEQLARFDGDDGAPRNWVFHVYATWNETTREIWFVSGSAPDSTTPAIHRLSMPIE